MSGAKTFIQYDIDETLEIKEEFIQDPETITVHEGNKSNKSAFCTIYIKEDDTLKAKPKLQITKKQEFHKSEQEMKYTCKKCARAYKHKQTLTFHQKFECGVMPQFSCKLCGKLFKRKYDMNAHVHRMHHKSDSIKSVLVHNCDQCSQSYTCPISLNQHKRLKHAVVKPKFICDFCGYKTNRKAILVKHVAARHS
ncbi:zinc finger protein 540-like [Belonocnema kinseyi]|uniref:zinc finger protein 540-like n=1 Tax=Belonocnema kinseyi TaxID=2817044 RepID=UPI00143D92D5|nr:zinc finger protein 540-like [Belonocnema kinseyi]